MSMFFKKVATGLLHNIKAVIQAIIFSVVIWLFISIQIFPDVSLHISGVKVSCVPTAFMNTENLNITSVDVGEITIQVRGKRYSISNLTADDFEAYCDLSSIYESGEHVVDVVVKSKDDTVECDIISGVHTAKVKVVKIISREIEVLPNISDLKLVEGMQIEGEAVVTPSSVVITGEEKLVNSIGRIEAMAEYDGALDQTADVPANLVYYSTSGGKILKPKVASNEDSFTVSVPVYKVKTLPVKVMFTNYPVNFKIDDIRYNMSINELTIASPDNSIDNLEAIDIGEISLSSLTLKDLQGGVALPVKLPEGYKNISGNKTVTVSFPDSENYGQLGFTALLDTVSIINAPANYNVRVLTNEMVVNVVGLSTYIQTMTSSDVFATINLLGTELTEGTKSVSVTFRLKGANVEAWVTGEEYKVEILVTPKEMTP